MTDNTIRDFGNQWKIHGNIDDDFWTSDTLFRNLFLASQPPFDNLENQIVCDVGSGSGRIIKMLKRYNPKLIYGIEPSDGFAKLQNNLKSKDNIILINESAESFRLPMKADWIFSLGVIHHIKRPHAALKNIRANLSANGYFVLWVYGREGNEVYLVILRIFKGIFRLMPDRILDRFCFFLTYIIDFYYFISKHICNSKLPLTKYMANNYSKCGREKKKYILFDQLNPEYAKYYKKREITQLLEECGFSDIKINPVFNYSWTVIAR